jgi:hypothetical protein
VSRFSYNCLQHKANAALLWHRKAVKAFAPLHQLVFRKENNVITKVKINLLKDDYVPLLDNATAPLVNS